MAKRDKLTIERHRNLVSEAMLKGYHSSVRVRNYVNNNLLDGEQYISDTQALSDIHSIKEELKLKRVDDINFLRNELLHQMRDVQTMFYEGYKNSLKPTVTITSAPIIVPEEEIEDLRRLGIESLGREELRQVTISELRKPQGDSSFLKGMADQIDKIAKLLGLDAPSKVIIKTEDEDTDSPAHQIMGILNSISAKQLNPPKDE